MWRQSSQMDQKHGPDKVEDNDWGPKLHREEREPSQVYVDAQTYFHNHLNWWALL